MIIIKTKCDRVLKVTKLTRLAELALEDSFWNEIVKKRDKKQAKFISHVSAWKL